MAVSGLITRPELGMSDLLLDNTTYEIRPGFDVGTVTRRRDVVRSPYVPGSFEVNSVPDQATLTLPLWVNGTTETARATAVTALLDAASQRVYEVEITVNGAAFRWTCDPADYSVAFDDAHLYAHKVPATLVIPRSPIPVAGPL